jgi:hypothetical protein
LSYIGKQPAVAALTASDITDGIISNAKLAQDIMSAETELTSAPAATDEFLLSDAGTLKRIDASLVGKGIVLQVINAVVNTETINNSDTFADTGLTASITPASTSNKILVIANVAGVGKANATYVHLKLLRDSTDLVADFDTRGGYTASTATNKIGSCSVTYLDSPSSTSSLAYKTQLKSGADIAYAQTGDSNGKSSITLMEIAG